MSATSPSIKKLVVTGALVVVAGLLMASCPAAAGAHDDEEPLLDPDRVATKVEIDDSGIVIHTESRDGGNPEKIEIATDDDDDLVIIRDGDARKSSTRKWKRNWKKQCMDEWKDSGEIHINWNWSDLVGLDCFDFDAYDDCDEDAIVHFGSDIHIGRRQHIEGDVVAIGGSIDIEGKVDGDVVAIGGSVTIGRTAEIDGDVVAVAGDLELDRGSKIEGDAVSVGGDIDDDGARIHGDTVLIEFDLW